MYKYVTLFSVIKYTEFSIKSQAFVYSLNSINRVIEVNILLVIIIVDEFNSHAYYFPLIKSNRIMNTRGYIQFLIVYYCYLICKWIILYLSFIPFLCILLLVKCIKQTCVVYLLQILIIYAWIDIFISFVVLRIILTLVVLLF